MYQGQLPQFTLSELTDAITDLPNTYGRLNGMGLFVNKPLTGNVLTVEFNRKTLNLVPTIPWGAPAIKNRSSGRDSKSYKVPQNALEDVVHASEVIGIRAFGTDNVLETVQGRVLDKLQDIRDKMDITFEWRKFGALKGVIYDADGTTILADLYDDFDITAKVVDFVLDNNATDVRAKCMEVKRYIEDNLRGEVASGVHAFCSAEFFDALVAHPNVKSVYEGWQAAQERLGSDVRKGFEFGGIVFEEYRAVASDPDGGVHRFIDANNAHFFPIGTRDTFANYLAPADFNETVNTLAREFYAKQDTVKMDRGIELHAQSNQLPLCKRPSLLVKGTI